jgi:hypothetical protein
MTILPADVAEYSRSVVYRTGRAAQVATDIGNVPKPEVTF